MQKSIRYLLTVTLLLLVQISLAQSPQVINYQAKVDSGGIPINGTRSIAFTIYDSPLGGEVLWGEAHPNVLITNGILNVLLGTINNFPDTLFSGHGDLFLGITVGGMPEARPRFQFASVAYALHSNRADKVDTAETVRTLPNDIVVSKNIVNGTITGTDIASNTIDMRNLNFSPLTSLADFGRSGVSNYLYEGSTTLEAKYLLKTGGGISGNLSVNGQISGGAFSSVGVNGVQGFASASGAVAIYGQHSSSNGTAVYGQGNGVSGYVISVGSGGAFTGTQVGVVGYSVNTSGMRAGGYFSSMNGSNESYAYVGAITSSGAKRKIEGNGSVNSVMETRLGRKALFAPESPEAWLQDYGHGRLSQGHARIVLDPVFLDCINTVGVNSFHVFVQPNDSCNGLYVKLGTDAFDVYELLGGKSNVQFSYMVTAKWKGYENERFPDALPQPVIESLSGEKR